MPPFQPLTRSLGLPKIPPSRALKCPRCPHYTKSLLASSCAIPASHVRHIMCSPLYYYYSDPPFRHNKSILVLHWKPMIIHILRWRDRNTRNEARLHLCNAMWYTDPWVSILWSSSTVLRGHGGLARKQRWASSTSMVQGITVSTWYCSGLYADVSATQRYLRGL